MCNLCLTQFVEVLTEHTDSARALYVGDAHSWGLVVCRVHLVAGVRLLSILTASRLMLWLLSFSLPEVESVTL